MRSEKAEELEEIKNLKRKIFELKIEFAKKREEQEKGNLTINAKKRRESKLNELEKV